jgi:hypothetical protein
MAVSSQQIVDFLLANPSMSDADIADAMATYGVSPADMAKATGLDEGQVAARVAATLPPNEAVLLGDTYVQAVNQTTGSGQDQQVGGLQNVITYKEGENKVGGGYNQYTPTGELERKGTQQEVNATKDFMDFALTAGTLFGLPAGIGESLGLTGATGQAVGQGLLTTGTKLGGGENLANSLKAGLLSGGLIYGGSQLSDLINKSTYDSIAAADTAGGLTPKFGTSYDEFMANIMDNPEAQQALQDIINGKTSVANAVTPEVAADTVQITGGKPTSVNIGNPFVTTPTLTVTGTRPTTSQNDVINAINTTIGGGIKTIPETVVTADRPKTTTIGDTLAAITTLPTTGSTTTTDPTKKNTNLTTSDIIKLVSIVPAIAAVNKVTNPTKSTDYPIVPVPTDWTTPTTQPTSAYQPLTPIDFGNQNLLKGTQWEKFLDPNYGKVPAPTQYSQPSNLSYNDLMGILGSKQGMPPTSSLSINDVISGIQNQYGQAPVSAMGQKPA